MESGFLFLQYTYTYDLIKDKENELEQLFRSCVYTSIFECVCFFFSFLSKLFH